VEKWSVHRPREDSLATIKYHGLGVYRVACKVRTIVTVDPVQHRRCRCAEGPARQSREGAPPHTGASYVDGLQSSVRCDAGMTFTVWNIYIIIYTLYGYCDSAYNIIYINKNLYHPNGDRLSAFDEICRRVFLFYRPRSARQTRSRRKPVSRVPTYISFSNREFGDRIPTSPPKDWWSWPSTCTFSTRVSFLWYLSRRSSRENFDRIEHLLKYFW